MCGVGGSISSAGRKKDEQGRVKKMSKCVCGPGKKKGGVKRYKFSQKKTNVMPLS
jgi:hypothetical protein